MRHFDYLPKYETQLHEILGLEGMSKKISGWRTRGLDDPDMLCVFCRKTLETALRGLLENDDSYITLDELICTADEERVIPKSVTYKCQEIRRKGNNGAHSSVNTYDAKMAFELLDDVLRWFVGEDIDPSFANASGEFDDAIFTASCVGDAEALVARARTAAALSGDESIERAAIEVRTAARERSDDANRAIEELAELIKKAQEISIPGAVDVAASQESLLDICDEKLDDIKDACKEPDDHARIVAQQVEEIISEHDFIRKLLKGDAAATPEQLDVMAFPRTQGATTNILQIAGGAGTGKTLCLLAKVISEIDDHGQQTIFGEEYGKKVLFVCFNKRLAGYVRELLAKYPNELPNIEITHFDEYVNQLVRAHPKKGYEHLASYAQSSRYHGWNLAYHHDEEVEQYLLEAIEAAAQRHPEQKKTYYLDPSAQENVDWVKDELAWLEAKYEDPESASADYPTAVRTGRGTKHRPDASARMILLEIWDGYRAALEANNLYTIEQATKRLLAEDDLPQYDAIAIDEVQDLSLISVRLLLKLRRSDKSHVFISGDENQKIYQRDFTWKELDSSLRGYTITLRKNKRNSIAIHNFSGRLLGNPCSYDECCRNVHVQRCGDEKVLSLLKKLAAQPGSSIALIGNTGKWESLLNRHGISFYPTWAKDFTSGGIHLLSERAGKGLEFDCVVVDYVEPLEEDESAEKNLRYVHFTRARHRLYVRYESAVPPLLSEYYSDFLDKAAERSSCDDSEENESAEALVEDASETWIDPHAEEVPGTIRARAVEILRRAYGERASFYPGQLEAIEAVVGGTNSLVVEKTGWGKSVVYFIATKILREDGAGPTVIISPLLALMDNQIDSARLLGVDAVTINSENKDEWNAIFRALDNSDAIIVSPERLSDDSFMMKLAGVQGIKLIVVDEAHSISDWGHDFRPDYQRVSKLIAGMPAGITVLGTTATANDRVIADIKEQLGENLAIVRGDLIRENLAIQINPLQTREQRLAWLASALTGDTVLSRGQGIVYCLTHNDCNAVSEYLSGHGISVRPYYSGMGEDDFGNSIERENLASFVAGETRILVATIKLGMGYDKSDIRFVVHFQLPQNIIAYYQQIGRAGRDGKPSYAILLHGAEDEEILSYFIQTAQAAPGLLADIVQMCRLGASRSEMLKRVNVKSAKLDEAIKYLLVHDYIYKDGSKYRASVAKSFNAEAEGEKQAALIRVREQEHRDLLEYLSITDCYMGYIARELDAPDAKGRCGVCANCIGSPLVDIAPKEAELAAASEFFVNRHGSINPRKRWGTGGAIRPEQRMQTGWVLCADYYSEIGQMVRACKYVDGRFSKQLIDMSLRYLKSVTKSTKIDAVAFVPSLRRPSLVSDLASQIAAGLGVRLVDAVAKTTVGEEQKALLNSAQQQMNIENSTAIVYGERIRGAHILLVDDMVDSKWTLTVIAAKLLDAGAACVYPFALVRTGGGE